MYCVAFPASLQSHMDYYRSGLRCFGTAIRVNFACCRFDMPSQDASMTSTFQPKLQLDSTAALSAMKTITGLQITASCELTYSFYQT